MNKDKLLYILFVIFLILALAASLVGCNKVPQVVTITEYKDRIIHDTTERADSIYIAHYITLKGDTIWQIDTIYKYKVEERVRDVYVRDSVPYKVEIPKYIRQRNGYDKATARGFWVLLGLVVSFVGFKFFKWFYLKRK